MSDTLFFATGHAFHAWLTAYAATASELVVGFRKVSTARPSLSWPESVDEALCFGWIDGERKRIDDAPSVSKRASGEIVCLHEGPVATRNR